MKVNLKMEKEMEQEYFIQKTVRYYMLEIILMIFLKDMVNFLAINFCMKVNLKKVKKMERVNYFYQMELLYIVGISLMMKFNNSYFI